MRDKEKSTCFENLSLKFEDINFTDSKNNLLVINLRNIDKIRINNLIKNCNFQIILSESLPQILDFLKKYREIKIEIVKIILLKNEEFEVKEYIFLIKK